jgi:hypothetical protein
MLPYRQFLKLLYQANLAEFLDHSLLYNRLEVPQYTERHLSLDNLGTLLA